MAFSHYSTIGIQILVIISRRSTRLAIGISLIALIAYFGLLKWAGWEQAKISFLQIPIAAILLALLLSLVNYLLRYIRWQYYLRQLGYQVPQGVSLRIYLCGFALTTTPAKAGEALRSWYLQKFNVKYSASLACFFSERLSDLLAVILLCGLGLWAYPQYKWLTLGVLAFLVLVIFSLRFIDRKNNNRAPANNRRIKKIIYHLIELVKNSRRCLELRPLLYGLVLSLVAWGAEGVAFYYLLKYMGINIALFTAIFIYSISLFVGALSFIPGGLIGAELTMFSLLIAHQVTEPQSIAATVMIRLTTLWFAVLIGAAALLLHHHINRDKAGQ